MNNEITSAVSLKRLLRWYVIVATGLGAMALLSVLFIKLFGNTIAYETAISFLEYFLQKEFFICLFVGFIAQMIDGTLGMAYGVSSTSFLMSTGISPAVASTSVHIAEIFTTGISGFSHWKLGNVDKEMLKKLAIPGAIGAAIGAYFLISFDGNIIKPYVSAYLMIMGIIIIRKAFKKVIAFKEYKKVSWLALLGGFVDASGGGGWGPVVTTTLIGSGNNPKLTIGTVNAAEFLVTLTASGIFTLFIGINSWLVIAGLIAGGVIAAPLAAYICHKINARAAMAMVGLLIIFLSIRTILKSFKLI